MEQRKLPRWLPGLFAALALGGALLLWQPNRVTEFLRGSAGSIRIAAAEKTTALKTLLRRPITVTEENQRLKAENAALMARLGWLENRFAMERQQDKAADLGQMYPDCTFLPVRLGGRDVTGGIWVIGEELLPEKGVLTDENGCLAAVIRQTAGTTALVEPITAEGFTAACWVGNGQTPALLEGDGTACRVTELPRNTVVMPGDIVMTNGLGGLVPKGLPVGTVETVSPAANGGSTTAEIRLSADLSGHCLYLVEVAP